MYRCEFSALRLVNGRQTTARCPWVIIVVAFVAFTGAPADVRRVQLELLVLEALPCCDGTTIHCHGATADQTVHFP
jgi:hypothetical protein